MDGGTRVDDTPMHQALWEALANCLVNADCYGRQGLVIIKKWWYPRHLPRLARAGLERACHRRVL